MTFLRRLAGTVNRAAFSHGAAENGKAADAEGTGAGASSGVAFRLERKQ